MMKLPRAYLVATMLIVGVTATANAQADSVLAVSNGGTNLLRLNTDAGFVVRGTAGAGAIPATGAGVRMMWFPGSWAFRAGQVSGTQWDAGNIGNGSAAFGTNTTASGVASFAAGEDASATGDGSVSFSGDASGLAAIAIGNTSVASGPLSTGIGLNSIASGAEATAIAGGTASGPLSVAIGTGTHASGPLSVAIGSFASTGGHVGAIVIGDGSGSSIDSVYATGPNQFVVRADGGITFYTNTARTAGVSVASGGGSWSSISDRNRKENFAALDGEDVLTRLRAVPVTTWNYRSQDGEIRHVGPMAQDFHAAFGLGESDLLINTGDIDGINLAAVKALEERTVRQQDLIDALETQVQALHDRLARLEALSGIEADK